MKNKLKDILSKIKTNMAEYYTLALIIAGPPVIAFIYVDWRLALSVFILVNIVLGVFVVRSELGDKGE